MNFLTFRRQVARALLTAASLALLLSSAAGADFSFTGTFQQDDEHRTFLVTTSNPTNLMVRTLSYGGGTNAAGAAVPAGGFDPSVAVFDNAGSLIAINRDDDCRSVAADPVTLFCWDSRLSLPVPAGTYQIVLTQSENTAQGPSVQDPFVYDGAGNFTADPETPTSKGFWDFSPNHRTSAFAVDIQGVDNAQLGLIPGISALVSSAGNEPGQIAPNTILTYYQRGGLSGGTLSIMIGGLPATILFSNDSQINFVVPPGVPAGSTVTVQISRNGTLLLSTPSPVLAASPALFTADGQGSGQAAILNQDYSRNGPSNPAKPGSDVMVYGTGFGSVLPPGSDGLSVLASGVSATIGGVPVEVTYAGLVPGATPGLQQVNLHLPDNCPLGSAVSIQLTIVGLNTQAKTTLAVSH
jgi:uncharacterized protein (TIGR03437 family)